MSRLYLISSIVDNVEIFYTADSNGIISKIGTDKDFTKGFSDDILALIPNSTYAGLTDGKLWMNTAGTTANIETTATGTIISGDEDAVSTTDYAGLATITATKTGSPKFALSFDQRKTWYSRGNVKYISTDKLLPTDSTARAAIATIDASYANMFDGDQSTSVDFTIASTVIPITLATATKIRKITGKLLDGTIHPVNFKLEVYDDTTSAYITVGDVNIDTTNEFFYIFTNTSFSANTKYQLTVSYAADGTNKTSVAELNFYKEDTKIVWTTIDINNISTQGMDYATLSALTQADYSEIFALYSLNYAVYLPSDATLTDLTFAFPKNAAPIVKNLMATPSPVHDQSTELSFDIYDPEKQDSYYQIFLNGVALTTEFVPVTTSNVKTTFLNNQLNVGTNTVLVRAKDETDTSADYTYTITKYDTLPTSVSVLAGNTYTMAVSDKDLDAVTLTATLNGEPIDSMVLTATPFTHVVTWDKSKTKIGEDNTLVVTLTDTAGGVTTITETFVGKYYGLMFADTNGEYYTTDLAKLLKYCNFGIVIAGRPGLPVQVSAINTTVNMMTGVSIKGPGYITSRDIYNNETANDLRIDLCLIDGFPINKTDKTVTLGNIGPGEKVDFYLRVVSTNPDTVGAFLSTFDGYTE